MADTHKYHTVKLGETLSKIAKKYGLSVEQLYKLNPNLPKDARKLQIGTKIETELIGKKLRVSSGTLIITKMAAVRDATFVCPNTGMLLKKVGGFDAVKIKKITSLEGKTVTQVIVPPTKEIQNQTNGKSNFEKYQSKVFDHEGGYVNDLADPGGATNKGIILSNFKAWAKKDLGIEPTLENLKKLTNEQAATLYKKHYWDKINGDAFKNGSVSFALYDWSITSGGAIKQFEKVLSKLKKGIKADGVLSSEEMSLINEIDSKELFQTINNTRLDYYQTLIDNSVAKYKKKHPNATEKDLLKHTLLRFKKGWTTRVNGIKYEEN